MSDIAIETRLQNLPTQLSVAVIMQRQPSKVCQWSEYQWLAIGVISHRDSDMADHQPQLVHEEHDTQRYLYSGYNVHLHIDECESYYYNLVSPTPRCYVIARYNDDNIPVPFLVSMSFDEAHSYLENDDEVYAMDVPPELYRWTEDFVLMHYAPEKRKKRKREDWKNQQEKR